MSAITFQEFILNEAEVQIEMKRVRNQVYKNKKHEAGFKSPEGLASWWIETLRKQRGCCEYCKTPIKLISKLISENHLNGRSVRGNGIRGHFLELEKIDAKVGYDPTNCALICYYCNNDKSNVYSRNEYVEFLAPAKNSHFLSLSKRLAENDKKAS